MTPTPHLPEHVLFECYLARQSGQPLDPRAAEHLADCTDCAAVFDGFATLMGDVRADGEAEADRVFTPERLRAQHAAIERRLRHVGRSARVISFPGHASAGSPSGASSRTAPRWVAAAAAAGLFIGVALGASYEWEGRAHAPAMDRLARASSPSPHVSAVGTRGLGPSPSASDEDAFLSDLEAALARPRTRELQPFDALTPHVRDVRAELRAPAR